MIMSIALIAACASAPPIGGAPDVAIAQTDVLPTPTAASYRVDAVDGLVRPMDTLAIDVFGVEDMAREVQVGADGTFDYPLIGTVEAAGRTPQEISNAMEERLRDGYLRSPEVTIRMSERIQQFVTVGGEVTRPGRFPVSGSISLMDAVALGGGMGEFANRDEVLVFRTVGANRYIGVYNLQGIQRGNYADPRIYANDIVMVGDSPRQRQLQRILQLTTALSSPIILLERVLR